MDRIYLIRGIRPGRYKLFSCWSLLFVNFAWFCSIAKTNPQRNWDYLAKIRQRGWVYSHMDNRKSFYYPWFTWRHGGNIRVPKRWALDPIGRSPFLPSWNLHKVELFSAFISHSDDISSWKCSWKCKSLQFERQNLIGETVGFEPTTQMVQCTMPTTRPLRICWMEEK